MPNARLTGIDAGRYIAIASVALIHTAHEISYTLLIHPPQISNESPYGIDAGSIINQLSRYAVPYFFIASGYFNAPRRNEPVLESFKKLSFRILPVFLIWSILYNLISPLRWQWFTRPAYIVRWILNGGAGDHLWFLPALLLWLTVALFMRRVMGWRPIIALATLFYIVGLCLGPYQGLFFAHNSQIIISAVRDGPSFGLVFILIGMWIRETNFSPHWPAALGIFIAGGCGVLAEAYMLNQFHIVNFSRPDFLACTLPFGAGAFLLALTIKKTSVFTEKLAFLGRYTLGIYAVHLLFVQLISYATNPTDLTGRLLVAAAALASSTLLVIIIGRVPALRFAAA